MPEYLAVVDTQRIHDFVFENTKLSLIRGASYLLSQCTEVDWSDGIAAHHGQEIFCGGGNALAIFPSAGAAREFSRKAVQRLRRRTQGGSAAFHIEPRRADEPFPGAPDSGWRDRAIRQLDIAKQQGGVPEELSINPYALFCAACGVRTASREQKDDGWFCNTCHARNRRSRSYWFEIFQTRSGPTWADCQIPEDLTQIGGFSRPENYIAFIYADLNNLGRRFQRECQDIESYQTLSNAVKESTRNAVFDALGEVLRPVVDRDGKRVAPFEIFLIGGDDAILSLTADSGIPFCQAFVRHFQNLFREKTQATAPAVSMGVVFCHSRYPVRMAIGHAEEMLRHCKRRAHFAADGQDTVDYLRIANSAEQPLNKLRAQQYQGRCVRPLSWAALQEIQEWCWALKKLPRTKVKRLYEILFGSQYHQLVLDYCYWWRRLDPTQQSLILPLCARQQMYATPFDRNGQSPFIDAIELMDFLPGGI